MDSETSRKYEKEKCKVNIDVRIQEWNNFKNFIFV